MKREDLFRRHLIRVNREMTGPAPADETTLPKTDLSEVMKQLQQERQLINELFSESPKSERWRWN